MANLADGQSGYTFSNLFKNVQTTLNSFGSSGLRKLKFKAKVQADAYLEFLKELYNQQPGCNTTNISALMFGDGQSAELGNIESSVIDSALENPLEDEDDLRAASEKELEEYGATATGLDIFKAELKKAQDKIQQKIADDPLLNEIAQKADALAPTEEGQKTERLTVPLIDPKDLDATHVVL